MPLNIQQYPIIDISTHIIKHKELESLINIDSWSRRKHDEIQEEVLRVQEEIKQIKLEAKKEILEQIHQENQILLNELENKLEKTFLELDANLYKIIYQILNKLGVSNISTIQVKRLIHEQLDRYLLNHEKATISANQASLPLLQEALFNYKDIQYKLNNELLDNECIYETNLHLFRVSISSAINQLKEILDQ